MKSLPITVIIPVASRSQLVREAIFSVLRQQALPQELIIALSPKLSQEVPTYPIEKSIIDIFSQLQNHKKKDISIHYICCERPFVAAARNDAAKIAKHPWLAFLDSDDLWKKEKLLEQWQYIKKRPHLQACHTAEEWWKFQKKLKQPSHLKARRGRFLKAALDYCLISCSALLIRKDTFLSLGAFNEEFEVCEDYLFFLYYLGKYSIGLCPQNLVKKRSGSWEQLSKKYHSLDLWRIHALFLFLEKYPSYKQSTFAAIQKKIHIVKKGALHHQNFKSIELLESLEKKLKEEKAKVLP